MMMMMMTKLHHSISVHSTHVQHPNSLSLPLSIASRWLITHCNCRCPSVRPVCRCFASL